MKISPRHTTEYAFPSDIVCQASECLYPGMEPRQLEFKTSPGSVCNFVCRIYTSNKPCVQKTAFPFFFDIYNKNHLVV